MKRSLLATLMLVAFMQIGCVSTTPGSEADAEARSADVKHTIATFIEKDPAMEKAFSDAYGYAVLPSIGKGAVGIGGAAGSGEVFEGGSLVGYCKMSQITIGFQWGGQEYSQAILFQDKEALDTFKRGNTEFSAAVSAVAVTAGAASSIDYEGGVAVFTMSTAGLMYEASVGGQGFDYQALE